MSFHYPKPATGVRCGAGLGGFYFTNQTPAFAFATLACARAFLSRTKAKVACAFHALYLPRIIRDAQPVARALSETKTNTGRHNLCRTVSDMNRNNLLTFQSLNGLVTIPRRVIGRKELSHMRFIDVPFLSGHLCPVAKVIAQEIFSGLHSALTTQAQRQHPRSGAA